MTARLRVPSEMSSHRVVSVLPSATEIVHALGHGHELVGRSAECDFPPEVRGVPVVMRPRTLDADRPSPEIDERVRAARARGESLYGLDVGRLSELRPDLLLTQDLCGVCSVTPGEVESACARAGVHPRILSLQPRRLEEVWATIGEVAEALGDAPAGAKLLRRLRSVPPASDPKGPRVAVVEWLDPPILAGLWTPDLIASAGAVPVGPAAGQVGLRTTWTELAREPIDLLLLSPCSFSVDRTARELDRPALRRQVDRVRPPRGAYLADEAYFSRPGPRLAEGIRLVRDLLAGSLGDPPMPVRRWAPAPTGGRIAA